MSIKGRIGLVQAERKWLNEMAAKYRYMHKAPSARSCTFGWAVTWDGKPINDQGDPYGFVIYALIHYTKLQGEFGYPGLPTNWQVLNLARLWLHDDLPRNSETWVIGNTLKLVQRRWLEVHPPPASRNCRTTLSRSSLTQTSPFTPAPSTAPPISGKSNACKGT